MYLSTDRLLYLTAPAPARWHAMGLRQVGGQASLLTHQAPPTLPPVLPLVEPPSSGFTVCPSALMNFLGAGL